MELDQDEQPQGFDLVVTKRHPKTGLIISHNPYVLRVIGNGDGSKMQLFERPEGSGNLYNKAGNPVGRWLIDEKTGKGAYVRDVEHVKYVAPLTEDQKLAKSLTEKDSKIAALEKELESIKAAAKKKSGS